MEWGSQVETFRIGWYVEDKIKYSQEIFGLYGWSAEFDKAFGKVQILGDFVVKTWAEEPSSLK